MWNCSHSDSRCWNPVKLRLWHSPYARILWERYHDSLQQLGEFAHQLDCILTLPLFLSLPMQPLQSQCQVRGDGTPELGRAVLHHCRCHQHAYPARDHSREWRPGQLSRLLAKQHRQSVSVIDHDHYPFFLFYGEWTLQRKGLMEPPSVVEEALQQDGP